MLILNFSVYCSVVSIASSIPMFVYRDTTSNEIGILPARSSWLQALNLLSNSWGAANVGLCVMKEWLEDVLQ